VIASFGFGYVPTLGFIKMQLIRVGSEYVVFEIHLKKPER